MNISGEKPSDAPIGVLNALFVGFDRVAARPVLLLPPFLLDLFLWLGPHLTISSMINGAVAALLSPMRSDPVLGERVAILEEGLLVLGERFNLLSALSAIPTGVPSLMSGSMPSGSPITLLLRLDVGSPILAAGIWAGVSVIGIGLGGFYHRWIAKQVTDAGRVISGWMAWWRLIGLALLLYVGILLATTITLLLASLAALVLPLFGLSVLFASYSFLLLIALYLTFTPHGIVRYRLGVVRAMLESAIVVRWNLLSTVAFLGFALGITWLTNQIWLLPKEDSWFGLLALLGHAFVSGTVLAASYAFYQGRREWLLRDEFGGRALRRSLGGIDSGRDQVQ